VFDTGIMTRSRDIACDLRHSKLRSWLTGCLLRQLQTIVLGVIHITPGPNMMW
jgi:hypothetical protein